MAGGIPLAIHLLHRSQVKTVRWGAMILLRSSSVQNQRRPKLEHFLLLLVRAGIPILLALCMSRPVLTGLQTLTGAAPTSTILLLDNSASMAATTNGRSTFERARDEAARIIRDLPRGSEIAVIPLDSPDKPLLPTSVNLKTAAEFVENLTPKSGAANVSFGLDSAARTLGQMHHAQRQIILLSDFQKANWNPNDAPQRLHSLERLQKLPILPKLILFNVASTTVPNIAIESLDFTQNPIGLGEKVPFRASLRNFSTQAFTDLRVIWKVDGQVRNETRISLESRSSAQTSFSHTFTEKGSHFLEVTTDADSVTADNTWISSIPVREQVSVLLVDGHPSAEPLQGETDFLALALRPRPETQSLLAPKTIELPALTARALSKTAVLVLANVRSLGPQQVREVEEFVKLGGGLLIFPGNRVDAQWYNQTLFRQGEGLLPASIESLRDVSTRGQPAAIPSNHFKHPALAAFNQNAPSLSDYSIRSWFSLKPAPPTNTQGSQPETLTELDNGDPLFVERRFGAGSVILAAIPCNAEWSNLPARPAFVPLMQRLVNHLAAATLPPRNISPGDPIVAYFQVPAGTKEPMAAFTRPDGTQYWLSVQKKGDRWLVETSDTAAPGIYTLVGPDTDIQHFAINAGRNESDPELLSQTELNEITASLKSTLIHSGEELRDLDRLSRFGQELWKPLLFAVLFLAFAEIFLQQRFRRRKGGTR